MHLARGTSEQIRCLIPTNLQIMWAPSRLPKATVTQPSKLSFSNKSAGPNFCNKAECSMSDNQSCQLKSLYFLVDIPKGKVVVILQSTIIRMEILLFVLKGHLFVLTRELWRKFLPQPGTGLSGCLPGGTIMMSSGIIMLSSGIMILIMWHHHAAHLVSWCCSC